jgi:hypothetical protein
MSQLQHPIGYDLLRNPRLIAVGGERGVRLRGYFTLQILL